MHVHVRPPSPLPALRSPLMTTTMQLDTSAAVPRASSAPAPAFPAPSPRPAHFAPPLSPRPALAPPANHLAGASNPLLVSAATAGALAPSSLTAHTLSSSALQSNPLSSALPPGALSPSMLPAPAHPHAPLSAAPPAAASAPATTTTTPPSNDDIEAVIQMAMASSATSPGAGAGARDTRMQLFVGNLPYRVRWQDLKDLFRRAGAVLRADVALGPDGRSRGHGTVLMARAEEGERAVGMFQGWCWQGRVLEVRKDRLGEDALATTTANVNVNGAGTGSPLGAFAPAPAQLSRLGSGVGSPFVFGASGLDGEDTLSPAMLSRPGTGTEALGASLAGSGLGSPLPIGSSLAAGAVGSSLAGGAVGSSSLSGTGGVAGVSSLSGASRPGTGAGAAGSTGGGAPSRNLFVGNLPFHIQWQDLKDLFRQAGGVARADVALGADGRSRGFGTVSFSNEADAERAVRMFNGYEYNGRPLKVHFDKFSAPSATAALAVPPHPASQPHSPAALSFAHGPGLTHQHSYHGYTQTHPLALAHATSFAQQVLQQQLELQRQQSHSQDAFQHRVYDDVRLSPHDTEYLSQQVQHQQAQQQQQQRPQFEPYSVPWPLDFLDSTPASPYDPYPPASVGRYASIIDHSHAAHHAEEAHEGNQRATAVEAAVMQDQSRMGSQTQHETKGGKPRPPPIATTPTLSVNSQDSNQSQNQTQGQTQTPNQGQSQSHTPGSGQSQSHPAHPGPITIPPPPAVSAFPVPPSHALSPQYYSPVVQSPMHHPALMGMNMGVAMTPHGLPPITPSMPSFTFLPQPSPLVPAPDGSSNNPTSATHGPAPSHAYAMLHGHGHGHAMSPFTPFSPGVTMSPGAFWGHPGSGAVNPLINPAVGAPVHAGSPGGYYWPRASEESQGYFPPVPVSMAMAQGNAQAAAPGQEGYFPVVPSGGGGPMSTGTTRPSGLANELRRGDSHGSQEGTSVGGDVDERARAEQPRSKSSNSEATTGTGTGTWTEAEASPRPASSQATSWHTDGERERAEPGLQELTNGIDALAVADGDGAAVPESGSGKPRAYSADCSPPQSTPAQLQRADSDPARRTVPDADASAGRFGLGIDMPSADRTT